MQRNDKWDLAEKSDSELYQFIAGWKPNTEGYIAGTEELRRRNELPNGLRSKASLVISFLALCVSVIALF